MFFKNRRRRIRVINIILTVILFFAFALLGGASLLAKFMGFNSTETINNLIIHGVSIIFIADILGFIITNLVIFPLALIKMFEASAKRDYKKQQLINSLLEKWVGA